MRSAHKSIKRKLLICSYAHNRSYDISYFKTFKTHFQVIFLNDYRSQRLNIFSIIFNLRFFLLPKVVRAFLHAVHVDYKFNKLSVNRIIYLIYRVGWISSHRLDGAFCIFRGVNDPFISYLKSRYGEKVTIFIVPHGTDFTEPKHHHWKSSDYWITDCKKFKCQSPKPEIVRLGRLEYSGIDLNNALLRERSDNFGCVGIICSHSTTALIDNLDVVCEEVQNASDFQCSVRLHPGDVGSLASRYQCSGKPLETFMGGATILLFPVGKFNWVSNVYYEALMKGYPAYVLIDKYEKPHNFNKELGLPYVYNNSQSILACINGVQSNNDVRSHLASIFVNSYQSEERIRRFIVDM